MSTLGWSTGDRRKKKKNGATSLGHRFPVCTLPSGWPSQLWGAAIFLQPGNLCFRAADARGQAGRKESGRPPASPSAGQGTGTHGLGTCFLLVAEQALLVAKGSDGTMLCFPAETSADGTRVNLGACSMVFSGTLGPRMETLYVPSLAASALDTLTPKTSYYLQGNACLL